MAKRITIMIEDGIYKKLREIQAKELQNSTTSVSFSAVINKELKRSLKK